MKKIILFLRELLKPIPDVSSWSAGMRDNYQMDYHKQYNKNDALSDSFNSYKKVA